MDTSTLMAAIAVMKNMPDNAAASAAAAAESAEAAQEVLNNIPQDYTELSDDVGNLKSAVINQNDDLISRTEKTVTAIPNTQLVDPSGYTIVNAGGAWAYKDVEIPVSNGFYYNNPIKVSDSRPALFSIKFLDSSKDEIVITNSGGSVVASINVGNKSVLEINDTTINVHNYLSYQDLVDGKRYNYTGYTLASVPAYMLIGNLHITLASEPKAGIAAGLTKGEWSTKYEKYGGNNYIYSDELIETIHANDSKIFETVEKAPDDVDEFVQLVNPERLTSQLVGNVYRIFCPRIPLPKDGEYFMNPGYAFTLYNVSFYNKFNERITFTNKSTGEKVKDFNALFLAGANAGHIKIEDKRILKVFVRYNEATIYEADSDISYMGPSTGYDNMTFGYPDTDTTELGITYGQSYENYVEYTGEADVEYEGTYNSRIGEYLLDYLKVHGMAVNNDMFRHVYPESEYTTFTNVDKYYNQRLQRRANNVIRFGTFNKFVSRGQINWLTIKKELEEHALDICGFQECAAVVESGVVKDSIGQFLKGWQFKDYAIQDGTVDKALASHWDVKTTNIYNILSYDGGNSSCINGIIEYPYKWYSNVISNVATISIYVYHGSSGGKTINGVSYTSYQVRLMEIANLVNILAQDDSDFIVILGDTNSFETGFDITNGHRAEWEAFRAAGFRPVHDGCESTVTGDIQNKYYIKAGDDKVYCIASYDQIFISQNIDVVNYNIVDSNAYPVEERAGIPVSDHCLVYADLKFNFDAAMQRKLADIATDTPWW